jgi:exonuclease-1
MFDSDEGYGLRAPPSTFCRLSSSSYPLKMGIKGLWPFLTSKGVPKPTTLDTFAGKRIAIDGYAWLHRSVCASAFSFVVGNTECTKYLQYIKRKVILLRDVCHVTPVFVFDGSVPEAKGGTIESRASSRARAMEACRSRIAAGEMKEAWRCAPAAVHVSPEMRDATAAMLRELGVEVHIAPAEADPLLAHLAVSRHVDAVIADDSDLIVLGVPCLISKLVFHPSKPPQCVVVHSDDVLAATTCPTHAHLRVVAVCAGCDYLPSRPGVAFYRALEAWKASPSPIESPIDGIVSALFPSSDDADDAGHSDMVSYYISVCNALVALEVAVDFPSVCHR